MSVLIDLFSKLEVQKSQIAEEERRKTKQFEFEMSKR